MLFCIIVRFCWDRIYLANVVHVRVHVCVCVCWVYMYAVLRVYVCGWCACAWSEDTRRHTYDMGKTTNSVTVIQQLRTWQWIPSHYGIWVLLTIVWCGCVLVCLWAWVCLWVCLCLYFCVWNYIMNISNEYPKEWGCELGRIPFTLKGCGWP